jgi:hypothetical protein
MRYRAAALSLFILLAWLAFAYPRSNSSASSLTAEELQQRRSQTSPGRRGATTSSRSPQINRSSFNHSTKAHRQECNSCHKFPSANWKEIRTGKDAFADITEYPEHPSCLKCHYNQFFARERPAPRICSVCHVAVTPRYTERKPFPNPPEIFNGSKWAESFASDFRINFPHETHIELVGSINAPDRERDGFLFERASFGRAGKADESDKSCAFCHQTYQPQGKSSEEFVTARPKGLADDAFWLKKGTFKTIPNHATCFTCHTTEGDVKPASNECATCHKLAPPELTARVDFEPKLAGAMGITDGNILMRWRRRLSSGTFRHEGGGHPDQSCVACHKVTGMSTLDVKALKVPVTACDVCHIGESADEGALNFEIEKRKADPTFQCTKCHLSFGKEPIPESHLNALPKPRKK